jgi:redox-sensitive bicupin YhaK (pirin superfamily)
MSDAREPAAFFRGRPVVEGAGVHLNRVFGYGETDGFDPFLMLDDFRSDRPSHYLKGFPWHPHRGIETITYMLEGTVEHGDSMGNRGTIGPGDIQWMTAGSGIIHQEMPKGDAAGRMGGFQLWANLPARDKMMDPRYREVPSDTVPEVGLQGGARVRVVAGTVAGVTGPVRDIVIEPEYLDVSVDQGGSFVHPAPGGRTVFACVIEGAGRFGEAPDSVAGRGMAVLYGDGDRVVVRAEPGPMRFLLVSGTPLREPVAWQGPIVMNTQEELRQAFADLDRGTFIRQGGTT